MAVKGRKQISITVSEKLLERVDAYCDENGVTRAAFFSSAAADKLNQFELSKDAARQLVEMLGSGEGLAALVSAAASSDSSGE